MATLVSIIIIIFGILQIILFFKLWGMTNDVRKIAVKLCPKEHSVSHSNKKAIVKATNEEIEVIRYEIGAGKYKCYNPKTVSNEWYAKEELIF